jgi:hypothetical protein
MNLVVLLIIVLVLVAVLPTSPYSSGRGYYPSGGPGLVLLILPVLMGRVWRSCHHGFLAKKLHQPCGLMLPSTSWQECGGRK